MGLWLKKDWPPLTLKQAIDTPDFSPLGFFLALRIIYGLKILNSFIAKFLLSLLCVRLFEAPRSWCLNVSSGDSKPYSKAAGFSNMGRCWKLHVKFLISHQQKGENSIINVQKVERLLQRNTRQGFMEHCLEKSVSFGATVLITCELWLLTQP